MMISDKESCMSLSIQTPRDNYHHDNFNSDMVRVKNMLENQDKEYYFIS